MSYIAKNDAYSSLAGAITDGDTQATVQPGDGDNFPVIAAPDYTLATLEDDFGNREIIKITSRDAASDTISFLRAQEGTTARAWPSGTILEVRMTAALMNAAIAHFDEDTGAHQASAIAIEPIGNISANDVQDALAELAAEKADANQINAAAIPYAGSEVLTAGSVEGALDQLGAVKAPITSPEFLGDPKAPTREYGNSTVSIATTAFVQAALQALYPVGSLYFNAEVPTNPATLFGFGTWVAYAAGRVPVGIDPSDPLFDTAGETGGSKDAVVVAHTHTVSDPGHSHSGVGYNGAYGGSGYPGFDGGGDRILAQASGAAATGVSVNSSGVSGVNKNLQPYITTYIWKRTA